MWNGCSRRGSIVRMKRFKFPRLPVGWLVLMTAVIASGPGTSAAEWSTDGAGREATISTEAGPSYESDGRLKLPAHYREWIFLSSGIDMSYGAAK
jgi:hypothetical protein